MLRRLMDGGGMDSGFARVDEEAWRAFGDRIGRALDLGAGDSVFDVGCGAGAFLYGFHERGLDVAGLDRSPELIALAAEALPGGRFAVAGAAELEPQPQVDAVVSMGAFLYFPSHAYAERVLDRMVRKARRAVAVLDVPDAATQAAALAERERVAGGPAAYAERYAGLDHRYYEREWLAEALRARGLSRVHVEGEDIQGYGNAPYRFNAWGFASS